MLSYRIKKVEIKEFAMSETNLTKLYTLGQSIWIDYISRRLIEKGKLREMIEAGLSGMTSNPTIFDKAISSSDDYDGKIAKLSQSGKDTFEIYDDITVGDIRNAADIFLPVYEKTLRKDGYVSLEINPKLAFDAEETVREGKRLYKKVNRPNVMFKVPSTKEGLEAVEELIAAGISVNVTLIFSLRQYIDSANAYINGIGRLLEKEMDASRVHSVASVFVSRIDTVADDLLSRKISSAASDEKKETMASLKGKTAVSNSALIYSKYRQIFSSPAFAALAIKGANAQRVLWGSTGTKNPEYSDIKYVTELIARDTVNTMPQHTLEAFLDHGTVKDALTQDAAKAAPIIDELRDIDIDIDDICAGLLSEGVKAFVKSFDSLLASITEKTKELCKT